ncbi:MAG TPA: type II secretion system protein [Sedimentisphaerales bacterium]|nr:type II secretion system protein [Sedimentisphaerales bacterium]
MSCGNAKYRGFLMTEIIVALTVLGMLLAGLGVSLAGFARFNRYQLTRQRCIAAAQAQLESIAATGQPIPDQDFTRLWPGLTVSVREKPGEAQWQHLALVEVAASGMTHRKNVEIQLSRYIRRDNPSAEGK